MMVLEDISPLYNETLKMSHKLDDQLNIYFAWENMIGVKLNSEKDELLQLHVGANTNEYKLIETKENFFEIYYKEKLYLSFFFCNHKIYTPIDHSYSGQTNPQCLFCE